MHQQVSASETLTSVHLSSLLIGRACHVTPPPGSGESAARGGRGFCGCVATHPVGACAFSVTGLRKKKKNSPLYELNPTQPREPNYVPVLGRPAVFGRSDSYVRRHAMPRSGMGSWGVYSGINRHRTGQVGLMQHAVRLHARRLDPPPRCSRQCSRSCCRVRIQ